MFGLGYSNEFIIARIIAIFNHFFDFFSKIRRCCTEK